MPNNSCSLAGGLEDMNIKPIKTEIDYKTALQETEHLFDCTRLEILTTLLEAYYENCI
jgi:antitoxin component HigA of HigAB toxin-antitoxin module